VVATRTVPKSVDAEDVDQPLLLIGHWVRDQRRPAIKLMPGILMLLGPGSCAARKSLPERLLSARQLLELSQTGLAEKLGVDRWTVGDWERGVRLPSEERLAAVEALISPNAGKPT
jgi:DNA-binding XRE family transcriptional regulator